MTTSPQLDDTVVAYDVSAKVAVIAVQNPPVNALTVAVQRGFAKGDAYF